MAFSHTTSKLIEILKVFRAPGSLNPLRDEKSEPIKDAHGCNIYSTHLNKEQREKLKNNLNEGATRIRDVDEFTQLFWTIVKWKGLFDITGGEDNANDWHDACTLLKNTYALLIYKQYKEEKDYEEKPAEKIKISQSEMNAHAEILKKHTHPYKLARWGKPTTYKNFLHQFEVAANEETCTPKRRQRY